MQEPVITVSSMQNVIQKLIMYIVHLLTFQEHLFVNGYCQSTLNIAVRYWWRVQYVLFCANCVNEENVIRICKIWCNFFSYIDIPVASFGWTVVRQI